MAGQPAVAAAARNTGFSLASPAGEHLIQWVWRYFSLAEPPAAPPAAAAAPPPAAPAAAAGSPPSNGGGAAPAQASTTAASPALPLAKRQRLLAPLPERVFLTGMPPLYFQHEGHSRTIIGVESRPTGARAAARRVLPRGDSAS